MKIGIYRSIRESKGEDNYGANVFTIYRRTYLVFIENEVFSFSTTGYKHDFDDQDQVSKQLKKANAVLRDKDFVIQNKISSLEDENIKFYLVDNSLQDKIIFEGKAEGEQLHLKRYRVSQPEAVTENTYQYLGTLEEMTRLFKAD